MVSPKSKANLRRGNPGNRGRPKSEVRELFLRITEASAPFIRAAALGEPVIDCHDGSKRIGTYDERMKAIEMAARYGLGVESRLELEPSAFDLSGIFALEGISPEQIGSVREPSEWDEEFEPPMLPMGRPEDARPAPSAQ